MAVALRPISMADVPDIARLLGAGPEIAERTARIPFPYTEEDARIFVQGVLASGERVYAITLRDTYEFIGAAGILAAPAGVEIGYWIGKEHWGRGYATEAVGQLLRFAESANWFPVCAHVFPENLPSARVLLKNGFVPAGELEQDMPLRGGLRRLVRYVLDRPPTT